MEDYDINHPVRKNFNMIIMTKRMFQSMGIVFLYYVPILQILSSWIANLILLGLLLTYRPHHRAVMNFIDTIIEIVLLGIHSLIVVIAIDMTEKFLSIGAKNPIG